MKLSETSGEVNITMSINVLYAVHITKTKQEKYENAVQKFTQRPCTREEKFDDHKFSNFVLFDTETNSTGELTEQNFAR